MAKTESAAVAAEMAAPAIAMRYGVPGEDGRMFELTAYVDRDSHQSEIDHLADKLRRTADRQRAIAQLPQLRHECDGHRRLYEDNRKNLAAEKAKLTETKKLYRERRIQLTAGRDTALDQARDEHVSSGRRGAFKPQGHLAGDLKRVEAELRQIDDAELKAENENVVACSQIEAMIDKSKTSVEILERRIAECEKLARGEDIHGVADA